MTGERRGGSGGIDRKGDRLWRAGVLAGALFLIHPSALAEWLPIRNLSFASETVDYGGESVIIDYTLDVPDLSASFPAYVFVRYSTDGGARWNLVPSGWIRGDGHGIVTKGGSRVIRWWGSDQLGLKGDGVDLKIAVRAIRMVRVPGGAFMARMIPGGGLDQSKALIEEATLPTYHIAKFETTVAMYADYLNEVGRNGRGWNKLMARPDHCGIERRGGERYVIVPGRENFPINYVSWYEAQAFLDWCGLRLPSELEFLKAFRGGIHLDGDEHKAVKNPLPERRFPWGDEAPDASGVLRCNVYIDDRKRTVRIAAVGSFAQFSSPYGACDLAGNVAEWTRDRHSTAYHDSIGIDGFRILKGGSYQDQGVACDAMAGASQLPAKRGSITGFRAVHDN
jgi:formylglycine-generating enzyme required for sulfatase activity